MIPFKHQLQHTTAKYADTIKEQSPEINMKMVNIDVKYMQFVDGQKHELQYDPLKKLKNKNKNKIGPVSGLVQPRGLTAKMLPWQRARLSKPTDWFISDTTEQQLKSGCTKSSSWII